MDLARLCWVKKSARSGRPGIPVIFTPRTSRDYHPLNPQRSQLHFQGFQLGVRNTAMDYRNQLGGSSILSKGAHNVVDEPDCGRATCGTAGILFKMERDF
ncbi:hypothetical protein D5086_015408 [Populus alba]|uniref:Uncharacterized protein n=1 Tax=Populus alba TaxID=43335 RepID=A0ACC4C1R5_POPAL